MEKWRVKLARNRIGDLRKAYEEDEANKNYRKIKKYLLEKYGELPRPDHFAIRSVTGSGLEHSEAYQIFSALGYRYGGSYWLPKKHIAACHFEPPAPNLEKIFFSLILLPEFKHDERAEKDYKKIAEKMAAYLKTGVRDYTDFMWLAGREYDKEPYLQELVHVLAYGSIPNHFTFLLKDPIYTFLGYTTMEKFAEEIASLGIPMQESVEGAEGSMLRQVSTKAAIGTTKTLHKKSGEPIEVEWPKTYVEFIERGPDPASPTGRFEGFIVEQATVLFDMTKA